MRAHADELEKPVVGPKLVCFMYSSFELARGERITEFEAGVHAMAVEVEGAFGSYRIMEGETFAAPRQLGEPLLQRDGMTVYRLRDPELRYALTGRILHPDDEDNVIIWLAGEGLTGRRADRRVLDRLTLGDPSALACGYRFRYGWDVMLGVE